MCGRYTLTCPDEAALVRGLPFEELNETRIRFRPRYNVAPGQRNPVLYLSNDGVVLADALWGLERRGGGALVNARSETAERSPRFRHAFRDGRCLVPADAFYEWRRHGDVNQPYLFRLAKGGLFMMAGLLEADRYVILTRDATNEVADVHDRMPVVLAAEEARRWLHYGKLGDGPGLVRTEVSSRVNSTAHDDPQCIAPTAQQSFDFD